VQVLIVYVPVQVLIVYVPVQVLIVYVPVQVLIVYVPVQVLIVYVPVQVLIVYVPVQVLIVYLLLMLALVLVLWMLVLVVVMVLCLVLVLLKMSSVAVAASVSAADEWSVRLQIGHGARADMQCVTGGGKCLATSCLNGVAADSKDRDLAGGANKKNEHTHGASFAVGESPAWAGAAVGRESAPAEAIKRPRTCSFL
jgi:hypothetical protein